MTESRSGVASEIWRKGKWNFHVNTKPTYSPHSHNVVLFSIQRTNEKNNVFSNYDKEMFTMLHVSNIHSVLISFNWGVKRYIRNKYSLKIEFEKNYCISKKKKRKKRKTPSHLKTKTNIKLRNNSLNSEFWTILLHTF